jgi:hypothetical protein
MQINESNQLHVPKDFQSIPAEVFIAFSSLA